MSRTRLLPKRLSLVLPLAVLGTVALLGMQGVNAAGQYAPGSDEAEQALNFDPYLRTQDFGPVSRSSTGRRGNGLNTTAGNNGGGPLLPALNPLKPGDALVIPLIPHAASPWRP